MILSAWLTLTLSYSRWPCSWNVFMTRAYLQLNIGQLVGLALLYLWDVFFSPGEYNGSVVSDSCCVHYLKGLRLMFPMCLIRYGCWVNPILKWVLHRRLQALYMNAGDKDQWRLCRSPLSSGRLQCRRSSLVYCSSTAQDLLQERVLSRRVK